MTHHLGRAMGGGTGGENQLREGEMEEKKKPIIGISVGAVSRPNQKKRGKGAKRTRVLEKTLHVNRREEISG